VSVLSHPTVKNEMMNVSFFEILVSSKYRMVSATLSYIGTFWPTQNRLCGAGAFVKVRIAQEDRGPHVVEVPSVDNSTVVPEAQRHRKVRSNEPYVRERGTVKYVQCEERLRLHRSGPRWQRRSPPRLNSRKIRYSQPVQRAAVFVDIVQGRRGTFVGNELGCLRR